MGKEASNSTERLKRQPVLVVVAADGFVQAFAESHIDVLIANVPDCPGHEALAEDVAELLMPQRYRASSGLIDCVRQA